MLAIAGTAIARIVVTVACIGTCLFGVARGFFHNKTQTGATLLKGRPTIGRSNELTLIDVALSVNP